MNEKQKEYKRAIFINNIFGFALVIVCGWCLWYDYLIHALCCAIFFNGLRSDTSEMRRAIESELYCDTMLMNASIMAKAVDCMVNKDK